MLRMAHMGDIASPVLSNHLEYKASFLKFQTCRTVVSSVRNLSFFPNTMFKLSHLFRKKIVGICMNKSKLECYIKYGHFFHLHTYFISNILFCK